MSDQRASRACWLRRFQFPKYWEWIVEDPAPVEQLIGRLVTDEDDGFAAYVPLALADKSIRHSRGLS